MKVYQRALKLSERLQETITTGAPSGDQPSKYSLDLPSSEYVFKNISKAR